MTGLLAIVGFLLVIPLVAIFGEEIAGLVVGSDADPDDGAPESDRASSIIGNRKLSPNPSSRAANRPIPTTAVNRTGRNRRDGHFDRDEEVVSYAGLNSTIRKSGAASPNCKLFSSRHFYSNLI
jgi:hypothetical protein